MNCLVQEIVKIERSWFFVFKFDFFQNKEIEYYFASNSDKLVDLRTLEIWKKKI